MMPILSENGRQVTYKMEYRIRHEQVSVCNKHAEDGNGLVGKGKHSNGVFEHWTILGDKVSGRVRYG